MYYHNLLGDILVNKLKLIILGYVCVSLHNKYSFSTSKITLNINYIK